MVNKNLIKYCILTITLAILALSCTSSKEVTEKNVKNPCEDSLYVKLKSMNKQEITAQELDYVKAKNKECREFKKESESGFGKYVIFIVLGALVALFIIGLSVSAPNLSPH